MEPALKDGDHVLTFNWTKIQKADVIVFATRHPELDSGSGVTFIKRVNKIVGDFIYVSGDNKKLSSKIGPITKTDVLGKVIFKY